MINPNAVSQRNQRLQLFQMLGFMLFLVLVMLDEKSRATHSTNRVEGISDGSQSMQKSSQTEMINNLNSMLALKRSLSNTFYPRNVSGIFFGKWSESREGINGSASSEGKVVFQLKGVSATGIPGIDYVYGLASVFHIDSFTEIAYPLQGAYLQDSGELALFSTPFRSQRLYIELPRSTTSMFSSGGPVDLNNTITVSTAILGIDIDKQRSNINSDEDKTMHTEDKNAMSINNNTFAKRVTTEIISAMERKLGISTWVLVHNLYDSMSESVGNLFTINNEFANEDIDLFKRDFDLSHRWLGREVQSDSVSDSTLEHVMLPHRQLTTSLTPSGIAKLSSILGLNLYLVDSGYSFPKETKLIPLGHDKLSATFMKILGERPSDNSASGILGGVHFHTSSRVPTPMNMISQDNFLPACGFDVSFNSIPYFKGPSPVTESTVPSSTPSQEDKNQNLAPISSSSEVFFVSKLSGNMASESCGRSLNISLTSVIFEREKVEGKVMMYSVLASTACIVQIAVFIVQLKYSQNPAATARISLMTMGLNAIVDAILCVGHMLLSAALSKYLNHSYVVMVSLLQLCIFGVLEMRLMMRIVVARVDSSDTSQQSLRRRLSTLNIGFFGSFFVLSLLFFNCLQRPVLLVFLFYSMWIPQIVYAAYTGTSRALHPMYLIGTTLARLYIPLYFLLCPQNFVVILTHASSSSFMKSGRLAATALVLWSLVQVAFLLMQDKYGSRFFIPKSLLPKKYDYHRPYTRSNISPLADVESGELPECIICYNAIDNVHGAYMLAPCDHIFHKQCLSQWMQVKLECPVCRARLPPAEENLDQA